MTTARRIIREVPVKGIEPVASGTMLVDGQLDYIDGGQGDAPEDAKYVAVMDAGVVTVVKDTFDPPSQVDSGKKDEKGEPIMEAAPNTARHSFAGWPVPGDVEAKQKPTDPPIATVVGGGKPPAPK